MSDRKHAILPASGAYRWMHCPPSARLEESFPDEGSEYAAEGTLAHAIAELKVRKKFVEPIGPRKYNAAMKKLQKDPLYQPDMESATEEYLDYISKIVLSYPQKPFVTVERRLDYSRYAPEGFGTADCIIIGGNTMHVIDYKHGKGVVVDVENNPQPMLYGLGALELYGMLYDIKNVALTIVQPRAEGDAIKEWNIDRDKLVNWGVFTCRPLAEQAFKGEGEFKPGEWCRFCRARKTCRHRAGQYTALEDFGGLQAPSKTQSGEFPRPPLLSNAEVGDVLRRALGIEKWVNDLKDQALSTCLTGGEIPGWKAVEGRKTRAWDDAEAAFNDIKGAGIDETMLYERKPLTLSAIEKTLGKPRFAEVAGKHVTTQPGKPALATETDSRPAITIKPSIADDFAAVSETKGE